MAMRVRRDVWSLSVGTASAARDDPWHPVLDTYARGVAAMQSGNMTPTVDSWIWAGFTHGIPSGVPARPLWDQCKHGSRFFLPWHRAYLAWFEQTVQAAAGDPTWALPYWDYSDPDRPTARQLPPEFTVPQRTVDGALVDNVLFLPDAQIVTNRSGQPTERHVDIVVALSERRFVRTMPRQGFGGVIDAGPYAGHLEALPHNFVHTDVGGLMRSPATAALDPIFWLHHANIDRLWEIWRPLPGSLTLPDQPSLPGAVVSEWNRATFRFGTSGASVEFTCVAMDQDPGATLGYTYERTDLAPALLSQILDARGRAGAPMGIDDFEADEGWEAVASVGAVAVPPAGAQHDLAFARSPLGFAGAIPSGVIVELADVRSSRPHPVYLIDVRASATSPWRSGGDISTFGLAGTPDDETRSYLVDVSAAIPALTDDGWDGRDLGVQVRPDPEDEGGPADPEITVGRITVYTSGA